MNGKEFQEQVEKEAGFSLLRPTTSGYAGVQIPTGKTLLCDLSGTIIREATVEEIKKWNEIWNRRAAAVFAAKTAK